MTLLDVPYCAQLGQWSCGLAAFAMAGKYLRSSRPSALSQSKLYARLAESEPHGSGHLRITASELVRLGCTSGLHAGWGRVSPELAAMRHQITRYVRDHRIPLIACQRYTDEEPQLGHFRVVIGMVEDQVTLHDPCPSTGGRNLEWSLEQLWDYWQRTGENVTGGVAVWIAKTQIENALGPDLPNPWYQPQR